MASSDTPEIPSSSSEIASLASKNSETLGASFPVITLPSGDKIPTGTIGALLYNIRRYDALALTITNTTEDNDKREKEEELRLLGEEMQLALPVLKKAGMFDLFTPDEWRQGTTSPGRKLVGEAAKKRGF